MDYRLADPRILGLEDDIADTMAVHEVTIRSGGRVIAFGGRFLRSPEMVYAQVSEGFKARGFVPVLRQEEGRDLLLAYPAPAIGKRRSARVNLLLFLLTVATTLTAGAMAELPLPDAVFASARGYLEFLLGMPGFLLEHWRAGLPFALALLGILGVHELGHYFVARHYRLDVSLPYFIPFLPLPGFTGTLGAVIRIQSPFESRKALFDVGIAGPLAGLAVAVPVLIAGLQQAQVAAVTSELGRINEPLLFQWLALLFAVPRGPGTDIIMNPLLMAGWWGLFVTALNLVPVSQLDGGHINYALFGTRHRYVAWAMFIVAALVTVLVNPGFTLMLILVFAMGVEHPPALNDLSPIGTPRMILGLLTLLLFFTLITPDPFPGF